MNPFLDTLVWLADLPVRHGSVFVFLGAFGGLGALALFAAAGREKGRPLPGSIVTNEALVTDARPLLAAARARAGLLRASPPVSRWPGLARILTGAMVVVLAGGAVLGVLGLARVPVTHTYIYTHGTEAEARVEGEWVAFVADDGIRYTLRNTFSSPSTYPASDPMLGHDQDAVTVRYLPGHPQTFVVIVEDTETRRN